MFKYNTSYRDQKSFEDRLFETQRVLAGQPDRVPIVIEPTAEVEIKKLKYLCSRENTVAFFLEFLRRRIRMRPEQALFLFIGNELPIISETMGSLYDRKKEDDGFLYIKVAFENTFGKSD